MAQKQCHLEFHRQLGRQSRLATRLNRCCCLAMRDVGQSLIVLHGLWCRPLPLGLYPLYPGHVSTLFLTWTSVPVTQGGVKSRCGWFGSARSEVPRNLSRCHGTWKFRGFLRVQVFHKTAVTASSNHQVSHNDKQASVGKYPATMVRYAATSVNPAKSAKTRGSYLRVSFKNTREAAQAINGMDVAKAVKYLNNVLEHKQAIPFRRFKGSIGRTAQGKEFGTDLGTFPLQV